MITTFYRQTFARHPLPWRVEQEEPYEARIVDANDASIDGIAVWLDDACPDNNSDRLQNARAIVDAINYFTRPQVVG